MKAEFKRTRTTDGAQMIRETDAVAGYTARAALKIGEAAAAGIAAANGLHYGA